MPGQAQPRKRRPKKADLGSKRLISLAPNEWAQWVTGRPDVKAEAVLAEEFQWIGRANDAVVRAYSPECGHFVVPNEVQLRATARAPVRLFAYAGLASEKFDLPAFPVLVNILPPPAGTKIADHYEANVLGLRGHQDYRVINLWEVDVQIVFERPLPALLPFVPVLRGGGDEAVVTRALRELRAEDRLSELEPLLAFFATFVLDSKIVRRIMRWDMGVLLESPWYNQIVRDAEMANSRENILDALDAHLGKVPPGVKRKLARVMDLDALKALLRKAITAATPEEFLEALDAAV